MAGKNKNKTETPIDATQEPAQTWNGGPIPDGFVVRRVRGSTEMRLVKAPEPDTRSAEVIFADRVEQVRVIMQRQFAKLESIGNARNAHPTPTQEAAFRQWLSEESDRALDALFGRLHAQEARGALLTSPDVTPGYKPRK